jgi:MoxR-like ATPase
VEQVKAGTGALVMIGGEPGVGKTRLAEQLSVRWWLPDW